MLSREHGYLNFIIANGVIVTARFWRTGMLDSLRTTDRLARAALERAFPGRKIVQVDVLPLIYDGGGLTILDCDKGDIYAYQ